MSKLKFRFLFSFLGIIIAAALIVTLRTGNGAKEVIEAQIAAQSNSGNIQIAEININKMEIPPLPTEHTEYTYEDMNHIYINGIKYDFPLKYSELPDEFDISLIKISPDEKTAENGIKKYSFMTALYYNNISWACGFFSSDTDVYDKNNVVIDSFVFMGFDKSDYLPQVVIGGVDVSNADPIAVDRAYGYNIKDYYCSHYTVDAADPAYEYIMRMFSDKIALFGYYPKSDSEYIGIELTTDKYYLPEDYRIEYDAVNNELEYTPIPEKNEEFKSALNNLTIHDQKITLPCTVNALLYALRGTGAHLEEIKYPKYQEGYDVIKCEAKLITNTGLFPMEFLITPGKGIGDAQVSMISALGNYSQYMQINGIDDSENGLDLDYHNELGDALTPYGYNNIYIYGDDLYVYYWGGNTTIFEEE